MPTKGTATTNKPWNVFRANGLCASVFENLIKTPEGERKYFKVSLTRTYREGTEFKSTSSLSKDDLPVAAWLLQRAWAAIIAADSEAE